MIENILFPEGLVKHVVSADKGELIPIIFDWDKKYGVALMNPSIYNDNGTIKACVRCVNYTLHHAEKSKYPHWYGPLQYVHPENDVRLATENFLVTFNDDLSVNRAIHIDMLNLHKPIWGFHGLEDGRLFRWDNKLYICGVRRDTTTNGQGRMELTELEETDNKVSETSRHRLPAPGNDDSYCEKNWMPILDQPYRFISWSNPTSILTYNIDNESITQNQNNEVKEFPNSVRGGTQVIRYKDYFISIGHDMKIWKPYAGEKDSTYYSYFMIWDQNFNLIKISPKFKFLNSQIEFCPGMCLDEHNNLLISFSDVDNVAYVLKVDADWLLNIII